MPLDPETREQLNTVLDSGAWKLAITVGFRASISSWDTQLLENEHLTEGERKGYIYAKRGLKRGIEELYEKLGRSIPSWISEEFNGRRG